MILAANTQVVPFEAWRRAVQDQFQFGGTFTSAVLAICGLAVLILITTWLSNRQRNRIDQGVESKDPLRLYENLVARLELLPPQRTLLLRMAKDLNLSQPTVALLSESIYDRRISEWLEKHGPSEKQALRTEADILVKVRSRLFPSGSMGVIGSQSSTVSPRGSR
ncbi:MAG: hypothetical protein HY287_07025 [Planctomycetes bacterium]|nr:hypothetical protein [Planctomycetota bacterium]MBI3834067.1 hypothetical protein [Planctomycetota bacterium]